MSEPAIDVQRLCKSYGNRQVLAEFTLQVQRSALFGFLGPNGAGKSTSIRILLGLLRATSGSARVFGRDVWRDGPRVRQQVGYLPGDVRFYDGWTGRSVVALANRAHGGGHKAEIARLASVFDLDLDKRVRRYSRGMKQKLGLIVAMLHRPALLILDEPTTALDPLVRDALYDELRAVVRDGRTVLFSSHTLSEVEALCDEVAILRAGRLVERERIEVLRARAIRHVEIRLNGAAEDLQPLPAGLTLIVRDERYLRATWHGTAGSLVEWLASLSVQEVTIAPPDLEDLFKTYYGTADGDRARYGDGRFTQESA